MLLIAPDLTVFSHQAQAHKQLPLSFDKQEAIQVIVARMDLSTKQLTKIYVHHWKTSGVLAYNAHTASLFRSTGETLRIDHTYKITRSVTAYSKDLGKRV